MVSLSDFGSVDSVLAMLGIVIGVAIFLMQQSSGSKINAMIKTQFKRQELEKKYFGTRLIANLELVKKNHLKLAQFLSDYLADHSQASRNKVKNYSVFQSTNLAEYVVPALRGDLGRLIEFIEDLKLVDELSSAFDDFPTLFKDCCVESTLEEPDTALNRKIESAKGRAEMIGSLLSRFSQEVSTTIE